MVDCIHRNSASDRMYDFWDIVDHGHRNNASDRMYDFWDIVDHGHRNNAFDRMNKFDRRSSLERSKIARGIVSKILSLKAFDERTKDIKPHQEIPHNW